MFKLRLREPKITDAVNPEVKQLFLGRNTVFSILSFIVGGVLVGTIIFKFLDGYFGSLYTFIVGLALFVLGGMLSKTFRK